MKLIVQSIIKDKLIHWVDKEDILASSSLTLYKSTHKGDSFSKITTLKTPFHFRMMGKFELLARALRLGCRCLLKLSSGTILVVADRKVFRVRNGKSHMVYSIRSGAGPLRMGWCEDSTGRCYMGEYLMNWKRHAPVNLIMSNDDGQSWETVYSFTNIRHIHFVQYDSYSNKIWVGTGDRDDESALYFSEEGGKTFVPILSGDQKYRAISLLFTPDYIYWGSDIPTRQNYIYRLKRKTGELETLAKVGGPISYSAVLQNGVLLFATNAEGQSEGRSGWLNNEAQIWASINGTSWENIASWGKDRLPYKMGFGTIFFPGGQPGNDVYFSAQALHDVGGKLIRAQIII